MVNSLGLDSSATPTRDEAARSAFEAHYRLAYDLTRTGEWGNGYVHDGIEAMWKGWRECWLASAPAPASVGVDAVDWRRIIRDAFVAGCTAQRERSLVTAGEYADRTVASLSPAATPSDSYKATSDADWEANVRLGSAATPVSEAEPVAFPADGELLNMEDGERANEFWRWAKAAALPLHMAESGLNRFHEDDRTEWAWQAWCAALAKPASSPAVCQRCEGTGFAYNQMDERTEECPDCEARVTAASPPASGGDLVAWIESLPREPTPELRAAYVAYKAAGLDAPADGDVALRALYEWHDRDGSVGGASEVFEKHRAALVEPRTLALVELLSTLWDERRAIQDMANDPSVSDADLRALCRAIALPPTREDIE